MSKKASALRNAKRLTGNNKVELDELSEIDNKVLGIVGFDYIEGTECPDSWPEELVSLHWYLVLIYCFYLLYI